MKFETQLFDVSDKFACILILISLNQIIEDLCSEVHGFFCISLVDFFAQVLNLLVLILYEGLKSFLSITALYQSFVKKFDLLVLLLELVFNFIFEVDLHFFEQN